MSDDNLVFLDVFSPHFRNEKWTWFRGALCTIDRSFGPVLDHTLHHITDTHVMHHLFSKMPFYHAQEATEAVRKVCFLPTRRYSHLTYVFIFFEQVMGPYYLKDDTPILKALYRAFSNCQFVEDSGDVVFYKSVK
jgi:omega-6 fatty acid desaturase (delta-12 desaturase)